MLLRPGPGQTCAASIHRIDISALLFSLAQAVWSMMNSIRSQCLRVFFARPFGYSISFRFLPKISILVRGAIQIISISFKTFQVLSKIQDLSIGHGRMKRKESARAASPGTSFAPPARMASSASSPSCRSRSPPLAAFRPIRIDVTQKSAGPKLLSPIPGRWLTSGRTGEGERRPMSSPSFKPARRRGAHFIALYSPSLIR